MINEVAIGIDLRRGIVFLLQHRFESVDYEEMSRVLETCWEENRISKTEGGPVIYDKYTCDWCPHLGTCRSIYDHKCPDSTIEYKIKDFDTHRPVCCGVPMNKAGHVGSGDHWKQQWTCNICQKRPIKKVRSHGRTEGN